MIQEEKELLLKDLCARLPYKPKCFTYTIRTDGKKENWTLKEVTTILINLFVANDFYGIVPYLRPMSSMTEEERVELKQVAIVDNEGIPGDIIAYIDWLNKHHIDYRGLIEKGLAIEAPEGMYS